MRVALDGTGEIAARTARILFAEASVSHIGFLQPGLARLGDRTTSADRFETYDVIASTGETPTAELVARASVAEVPLVLWRDEPRLHRGSSTTPVVVGANLGSALTPALAHHPSAAATDSDTVTLAWTEPGKPLRRGEPVIFPEPVGPVWAEPRTDGSLVARTPGHWAGALATVAGAAGERVVGVSDHGAHLEALTLSAVALLAADGGYGPVIGDASANGAGLLTRMLLLELDVAVWRSSL